MMIPAGMFIGPKGDPYFANVQLLLHCDGADGSTAFSDSSSNAFAITVGGNAQIDTAQSKFGGASALFDGTTDFINLPTSSILNLPDDLTIEFWLRPNVWGSSIHLVNGSNFTIQRFETNNLVVYDGSNRDLGSVPATGTWHHLALVRSGMGTNNCRVYLNGAQTVQWTQTSTTVFSCSGARFGARLNGAFSYNGWLDDIRITKGVARYTGAFAPPTMAFPSA